MKVLGSEQWPQAPAPEHPTKHGSDTDATDSKDVCERRGFRFKAFGKSALGFKSSGL